MSAASFEKSRLELVGTLQGHSSSVNSMSFSPDGTKVASGSNDNTVKLWDVTSGECLQTLEGHSNWLTSSMYDICDIKSICHIAYLVCIFFFYFRELKKTSTRIGSCLFVLFVRGRRSSQVKVKKGACF